MAEPEVLDLTFDSASDDEDRAPPVRAPGYKNHNAPGLREAPASPAVRTDETLLRGIRTTSRERSGG